MKQHDKGNGGASKTEKPPVVVSDTRKTVNSEFMLFFKRSSI